MADTHKRIRWETTLTLSFSSMNTRNMRFFFLSAIERKQLYVEAKGEWKQMIFPLNWGFD